MTTPEQIEVMEFEGYSRPMYNKLVHSATTRSTVVGVIHKLTVDEFVDCANRSPKCTNHSRDHDHARLGDSQSSQC